MPTTYIQPLRSMKTRLEYVTYGRGLEREQHLSNGTSRALVQTNDLGDIYRTYSVAREACKSHAGRHVEGYEVRVSWSLDELDPNNQEDVEKAVAFGNELCSRLFPNSPRTITAHSDGVGGCLHLHCDVVNLDMETSTAIRGKGRYYKTVVAVSKELSKQWDMQPVKRNRGKWAERKCELEAKVEEAEQKIADGTKLPRSFTDSIVALHFGSLIEQALLDESVVDFDSFERKLNESGVEIQRKTKKNSGEVVGYTYKGKIEIAGKTRSRRLMASKVCSDFDFKHIDETIAGVVADRREAQHQQDLQQKEAAVIATANEHAEIAKITLNQRKEKRLEKIEKAAENNTLVKITETPEHIVVHPDLHRNDAPSADYELPFKRVEQIYEYSSKVLSTPEFEDIAKVLPPVPKPTETYGAAADVCNAYAQAAQDMLLEGNDNVGRSFILEAFDRVVDQVKGVWSRVVARVERALKEDSSRGRQAVDTIATAIEDVAQKDFGVSRTKQRDYSVLDDAMRNAPYVKYVGRYSVSKNAHADNYGRSHKTTTPARRSHGHGGMSL